MGRIDTSEAKAILKTCKEQYPTSLFVIIKVDRNPETNNNQVQVQTNAADRALLGVLKAVATMVGTRQN